MNKAEEESEKNDDIHWATKPDNHQHFSILYILHNPSSGTEWFRIQNGLWSADGCLVVVAQWWEHWWLKSVAMGSIPSDYQPLSSFSLIH